MMANLSYPPPTGPIPGVATVNPRRRLAPLESPPISYPLPKLSSAPRDPVFTPTHALSTHIIPAAFPRHPTTPGHVKIPDHFSTNEERKKWIKEASMNLLVEKRAIEAGRKVGQVTNTLPLWNVVNRISRNKPTEAEKTGITLVITNPIGFHKEIWEPALKHLIAVTEGETSPVRVEELWCLEAICHGDSGIVNGANMPKIMDRADYGRDIANLCIHYIPERNSPGADLPPYLPRLDSAKSQDRIKNGYKDRTLVGLGHSLGGDGMALFAISYPVLISACILVETTIFPATINSLEKSLFIVSSTMARKSSWKSREEARAGLLKSPLFNAFHRDVLDSYLTYGIYENLHTGLVELKCRPTWEASEFSENRVNNEAYEILPTLDERIEIKWILGGNENASNLVGGPHIAQRTVWRRPKNASNIRIAGAGHLVVQENPFETAEEIYKFLSVKFAQKDSASGEARRSKL